MRAGTMHVFTQLCVGTMPGKELMNESMNEIKKYNS